MLIKEVKNLQLEVDECNAANDKLCELTEEMERVMEKLRAELERLVTSAGPTHDADVPSDLQSDVETCDTSAALDVDSDDSAKSHVDAAATDGDEPVDSAAVTELSEEQTKQSHDDKNRSEPSSTTEALQAAREILQLSRQVREQNTLQDASFPIAALDGAPASTLEGEAAEANGSEAPTTSSARSPRKFGSARGRRRFSVSSLLNMDSLSLADIREKMIPESLRGVGGQVDDDSDIHASSSGIISGGGGQGTLRKTSIKLFTDLFSASTSSAADADESPGHSSGVSTPPRRYSHGASMPLNAQEIDDTGHDRARPLSSGRGEVTSRGVISAGRPTNTAATTRSQVPICFKCGGTVEGPKYSTCKCTVPQLTPGGENHGTGEYRHQTLDTWKNMINKTLHSSPLAMKLAAAAGGGGKKHPGDSEGENQLPVLLDPDDF